MSTSPTFSASSAPASPHAASLDLGGISQSGGSPSVRVFAFIVPEIFKHASFECNGDMIIQSGDGVEFCVPRSMIWQASCLLRSVVAALPSGLPTLPLPESAETLCALLQALYPFRRSPITSVPLAKSCIAAARKYHINPAGFPFHPDLFTDTSLSQHPFFLATLAWNSRQWSLVQKAARYLHAVDTMTMFIEAMSLSGGGEVLAAVLATRLMRHEAIADVVRRVPHDILCAQCRGSRNIVHELEAAFSDAFDTPYPSITSVLFNGTVLNSTAVLQGCTSQGCWTSISGYSLTSNQLALLTTALEAVPTTIPLGLLELKSVESSTYF